MRAACSPLREQGYAVLKGKQFNIPVGTQHMYSVILPSLFSEFGIFFDIVRHMTHSLVSADRNLRIIIQKRGLLRAVVKCVM